MNIEKFEAPVLEVEEVETKDIITTSPGEEGTGDNDYNAEGKDSWWKH